MHRSFRLAAAALVVAACSNAGAGRVLSIPGAGQVAGQVYFDANGNGNLDAVVDSNFRGVSVKLVATGTTDTVARAVSAINGTFTFSGIPVGNYTIVVDTATIAGIDLHLTRITVGLADTSMVTITPSVAVPVAVAISYRQVSLAQARLLAPGTQVFVVGVALANAGLFGDSVLNLADTSGALRITAVRNTLPGAGDTLRVLGVRGTRDNVPVLTYSVIFNLGINHSTPVDTLTVAQAVGANGTTADAALVTLKDTVVILDTATFPGYRRLHVKDTSAAVLEVRLDSLVGFVNGPGLAKDSVGAKFALSGLLLPTATPGIWMLKPRAPSDQTP